MNFETFIHFLSVHCDIYIEEETKGLVSASNPDEIFSQLKEQLKGTPVFKAFTEMLQKLLLVRRGGKQGYSLRFPYRCSIR
jgi:hypothetical protein